MKKQVGEGKSIRELRNRQGIQIDFTEPELSNIREVIDGLIPIQQGHVSEDGEIAGFDLVNILSRENRLAKQGLLGDGRRLIVNNRGQ